MWQVKPVNGIIGSQSIIQIQKNVLTNNKKKHAQIRLNQDKLDHMYTSP
jgi:hypothetical protein